MLRYSEASCRSARSFGVPQDDNCAIHWLERFRRDCSCGGERFTIPSMPGPRIYTPRRRLVMQVVMWLILGATVGLAELGVQAQQRAGRVGRLAGLLVAGEFEPQGGSGGMPHKQVVARVVLPAGNAIELKLEGPGALDPTDKAVVEEVAGSMQVSEPELEPGNANVE